MKFTLFLEVYLFSLATYGWQLPPKGHEWHPPVFGDSESSMRPLVLQETDKIIGRSPCPGLNVMANHGFLPRSGKDIDLAAIRTGVSQAYNYTPTTFDSAFKQAIDLGVSTTGNASTFNLEDLKKHDAVEFDGSLSRNDAYFGDDNSFNHFIWGTTALRLGLYNYGIFGNDTHVTVETAARARAARVRDAMAVNPDFNASANEMTGSPGTTALYLTTLWDDEADAAPKAWVRAFFGELYAVVWVLSIMLMMGITENERIPYLEGYQPPTVARDGNTIGEMFARVTAVNVSDILG